MNKNTLGVAIITKNNASSIRMCLESVAWADEIIILDSGSTDNTLEICQEFTPKIFVNEDWPGFGKQKNIALNYISCDWVLSLDADEVITPRLHQAISQEINNCAYSIYKIKRIAYFLGKRIRFVWSNDAPVRLFKRDAAKFSDDIVHESLIYTSKCGTIDAPMLHYTCSSIEEMLDKSKRYALLGAKVRYARGKRSSVWRAIVKAIAVFLKIYIFKLGFLDGKEGLILSVGSAQNSYYCALELWHMQFQAGGRDTQ